MVQSARSSPFQYTAAPIGGWVVYASAISILAHAQGNVAAKLDISLGTKAALAVWQDIRRIKLPKGHKPASDQKREEIAVKIVRLDEHGWPISGRLLRPS